MPPTKLTPSQSRSATFSGDDAATDTNNNDEASSPSHNNNNNVPPEDIRAGILQMQQYPPKILWSCVARDDLILAEASDTVGPNHCYHQKGVLQAARQLLKQGHTPGFEYCTHNKLQGLLQRKNRRHTKGGEDPSSRVLVPLLKGIKFHVYEHVSPESMRFVSGANNNNSDDDNNNNTTTPPKLRIWVFAAVFDAKGSTTTAPMVQSFLEKIVHCTESMRLYDPEWKAARGLGLQTSFGPILQQLMQDVASIAKVAVLQHHIYALQHQMEQNITLMLDNAGRAEDLQREASRLKDMCKVFKKQAKKLKRHQLLQNAKYGIVAGTVVTGLAAAVIVPIIL